MDEEIFLRENRIIPDWKRVEERAVYYGLSSVSNNYLNDIADLWTNKMMLDIDESTIQLAREVVNYTYAALLKIVLIHKASKQNVIEKMQKFYNFLDCELNCVLGRESAIAAYFFSNQMRDKFIQVQAEMSFADVKKRLFSTAWDFLLWSIPEIQLHNGTEQ